MNTQLITPAERKALVDTVEELRYRLPHPIADTVDVRIVWDERYTAKNGILASYSVLKPNQVNLAGYGIHALGLMVPWLCHELRHMHQFKTLGWIYHVLAVPFLRNYTIEPSAYAVTEAAEKLMETTP